MNGFPVLFEQSLPEPARTWYGKRYFEDGVLPEPDAGTLLVVTVHGEVMTMQDAGHLLPQASQIALVDMRPRSLFVELPLPDTDQVLKVGFRCRVIDPVSVVRQGLFSIFPELERYLTQSRQKLRWSRLMAQAAISPPEITGMHVHLISAEVSDERGRGTTTG